MKSPGRAHMLGPCGPHNRQHNHRQQRMRWKKWRKLRYPWARGEMQVASGGIKPPQVARGDGVNRPALGSERRTSRPLFPRALPRQEAGPA